MRSFLKFHSQRGFAFGEKMNALCVFASFVMNRSYRHHGVLRLRVGMRLPLRELLPVQSHSSIADGVWLRWKTRNRQAGLGLVFLLSALLFAERSLAADAESAGAGAAAQKLQTAPASAENPEPTKAEPWDFSPYRVLIWIASDDPTLNADTIGGPLRAYLDRDFSSIWRVTIADAPSAVATVAGRDMAALDFETISASDPVIAVKRDHPDAIRIRIAANVGEYVSGVFGTTGRIEQVNLRAEASGNPTLDGVHGRLQPIEGDESGLHARWSQPDTEAILVTRGMALTLTEPEAKIIKLPIDGLISDAVEEFDKVFIVRAEQNVMPHRVTAIECDTLMRFFGPVRQNTSSGPHRIVETIGRTITEVFAPTVRIDEAGQKTAEGLLRAGGLIVDENSPGLVAAGDTLVPMTRKNDRNGKPILIGPLDWAFLLVKEVDGVKSKMDYYSGRAGGLQGRQNQRTFRTALKVRPPGDETTIRLHAQGDEDFPLIGYEIYERELDSPSMAFVGRTDWNGQMLIRRTKDPLRLLYVKNGGAVLARLPIVPGLTEREVADLGSDDMRLQAEAYIRGVQNAIIDLVAIRELFAARVRLRLEKGQMQEAEQLLSALRKQPTNEKLANDMGKKETEFLNLIGPKNPNQYRKVENMFSSTREMLSQHISPKIINELEADMIAAERNGGKLPKKKSDEIVVKAGSESGQPEAKTQKGKKKK